MTDEELRRIAKMMAVEILDAPVGGTPETRAWLTPLGEAAAQIVFEPKLPEFYEDGGKNFRVSFSGVIGRPRKGEFIWCDMGEIKVATGNELCSYPLLTLTLVEPEAATFQPCAACSYQTSAGGTWARWQGWRTQGDTLVLESCPNCGTVRVVRP